MLLVNKRVLIIALFSSAGFGLAYAAQQSELPAPNLALGNEASTSSDSPPEPTSSPTPSFQLTLVATVQAQDTTGGSFPDATPQFSLRGFTPDASRILISKLEEGKQIDASASELITTYELVDLNSGVVKPLATLNADADFAFGAAPPKVATRVKSAPAKTNGPQPWLEFFSPTNVPPPKDRNMLRSLSLEEENGRMVYTGQVALSGAGNNTQWGDFVVLRRFDKGVQSVQSFRVDARDSLIFLPQWSPDGQRVLFKVGGQGDPTSTYLIHLWNTQTGRIEQGPKEFVSYLHPRWSPNSKRIAYVVGGNINGENEFLARTPASLRVYDVATGKSYWLQTQVSGGQVNLAQFQWQSANSLLYARYVLPASVALAKTKAARQKAAAALNPDDIHPAIFQVAATGGPSKQIILDGFKPMPSPDGRWIAFFGWPDAKDARAEVKANAQSRYFGPRLFLWERATKQRFLVRPNIFSDGTQLKWTPDSHKLVLLQSKYDTSKAQGTANISTITINNK